jgi:hypothetical protein
MDAAGLAVNAALLLINAYLFLASLTRYQHASRLLDDARKLALRALLLKRKV